MINNTSRIKNSIKNMTSGIFLHLITLIIQFTYRILFVRILGAEYLGIKGLFSNILSIFAFTELGIGQAIVFSLYKPIAEHNENKICALMGIYKRTYYTIGCIVLFLGLCFYPIYPHLITGNAKNIPGLSFIYSLYVLNAGLGFFFSYRTSFLNANQQKYILDIVWIITTIVLYACQIILLIIFKNYLIIISIQICITIIQNAIASHVVVCKFPYLKKKAPRLEDEDKKKIISDVKALIIYKIGTKALNSTDNIIISIFVGTVWVGYYDNYLAIVSSVSAFAYILFASLTASIGNLNAIGDDKQKKLIFKVCDLATFIIFSTMGVCFYIALDPFTKICYGEQYVLGSKISAIIALNLYVAGMLYAPYNYRQTMGLFIYGKWRPIISAIENILVSIFLAKYIGLAGVLLGTIITRLTTNSWYDPYIVYKKGFHESPIKYYVSYAFKISIFIFLCIFCKYISNLYDRNNIFIICVKCFFVILYCLLVISLIYWNSSEMKYLKDIALQQLNNTILKLKKGN